jgi:hypothetical protein
MHWWPQPSGVWALTVPVCLHSRAHHGAGAGALLAGDLAPRPALRGVRWCLRPIRALLLLLLLRQRRLRVRVRGGGGSGSSGGCTPTPSQIRSPPTN